MKPDCWNCKHMRLGFQSGGDACSRTGRVIWMERSRPWWHGLLGNRGCGKAGRLFEAGMPHDPFKHLAHE